MTPNDLVGETVALFDARQESPYFGFRAGPCVAVDSGPRKGFRRLCLLLGPHGAKSRVWFPAAALTDAGGQPAGICRGANIVSVDGLAAAPDTKRTR